NSTWRRARHSKSHDDWLSFRKIRNKSIQAIRKAKVDYFHNQFNLCGSNPRTFWKTVKEMENKPPSSHLSNSLVIEDTVVTGNERIAELFNQHFVKCGNLFGSIAPPKPPTNTPPPSPSSAAPCHSFCLQEVSENDVLEDSFQRIQSHLSALGLVLNTTKTKIMWFGRSGASQTGTIVTADGRDLEI
ncbi:hypothetical protein JOQ06_010701, partial [Pogonophryne albipinna]